MEAPSVSLVCHMVRSIFGYKIFIFVAQKKKHPKNYCKKIQSQVAMAFEILAQ